MLIGTGKTTVARLYGQILREFGLLSNGDLISVTASDLMGSAVGVSAEKTAQFLKQAEGKVLFIDEAYVLDPTRGVSANYGGDVLDTIVQKVAGAAGADMAVILAGYTGDMLALLDHANAGFTSRFQLQDAIYFDDYSDDELKKILLYMCNQRELVVMPETAREVVRMISQLRRMPNFGNARLVENFLGRAMVNKSKRLEDAIKAYYYAKAKGLDPGPDPGVSINRKELIIADFQNEELSAEKGRMAFDNMYNMGHVKDFIDELEATLKGAISEGKNPADLVANSHMVFVGPPGSGKVFICFNFFQ